MSLIVKALLLLGLIYLVFAGLIYLYQRKLTFSPDPSYVPVDTVGIEGLREVEFSSADGHRLYSWYLPARSGKATMLYFHGNGGNVANREDKFRQLSAAGYGVFMLGYRGFGGSEGNPSEAGFVKDATIAYQYLSDAGLQPRDIVIYGESIGTSVAVQLAAKADCSAIILEAPMHSVLEIGKTRYPHLPVERYLRDPFLTYQHIDKIRSPLLVIHGSADGVIPLASGEKLFNAAPGPKQMHVIKGGGHNNLYEYEIVPLITRFLIDQGLEASTIESGAGN